MVKLLEPFEDFKPTIRGWSGSPKYKMVREVKPKEYPLKLTLKTLKKIVRKLRKQYPSHDYRLEKVKLHDKIYYRLRRGETDLKNPPIYIDLETGRIYVPSSYVKRKKRLVASVIDYRLRSLGAK